MHMGKSKSQKLATGGTYVVSSDDKYYDDCPVCRLMKKAEEEGRQPTEQELEEAFKKANTQN